MDKHETEFVHSSCRSDGYDKKECKDSQPSLGRNTQLYTSISESTSSIVPIWSPCPAHIEILSIRCATCRTMPIEVRGDQRRIGSALEEGDPPVLLIWTGKQ